MTCKGIEGCPGLRPRVAFFSFTYWVWSAKLMGMRRLDPNTKSRLCSLCGYDLPLKAFYKCKSEALGRSYGCKECIRKRNRPRDRKRYRDNPQRRHKHKIQGMRARGIDIDVDTYLAMVERQSHKCAICDRPETRIIRGKTALLAVDHDHKTGKPRELLCSRCNVGIGMLGESPELFEKARNYIQKHSYGETKTG